MYNYLAPRYQRFSQKVVEDIRNGNYAIADMFLGGEYVCCGTMMERSEYPHLGWAVDARTEDEWSLYLISWLFGIFPTVSLVRGKDNFKIKLTRAEQRGLAEIFRAIFAERKERINAEKRQYKINERNAYWHETNNLLPKQQPPALIA